MVWVITFGELGLQKQSSVGFAELGSDMDISLLRIGIGGRSSVAFSSPDSLVISPISLCDQNYFHVSKFRYHD
jgi:hypothetical protein